MAASQASPESEARHTPTSDNVTLLRMLAGNLGTRANTSKGSANNNEGSTPAKATRMLQRPEKGYRTYDTDGPQRVRELSLRSPAVRRVPALTALPAVVGP